MSNAALPSGRVARNIRAEMVRSDVKQAALATGLGLTPGAVSHRLTGRTPITIDELVQVARLLSVSVATLLAGVEPESAAS